MFPIFTNQTKKKANILDLYSGVGSFGIECLSRYLCNVVFVEKDPLAFSILRKVQPYFGGPNFANLPLFFRSVKIEEGTWILVVFLLLLKTFDLMAYVFDKWLHSYLTRKAI